MSGCFFLKHGVQLVTFSVFILKDGDSVCVLENIQGVSCFIF